MHFISAYTCPGTASFHIEFSGFFYTTQVSASFAYSYTLYAQNRQCHGHKGVMKNGFVCVLACFVTSCYSRACSLYIWQLNPPRVFVYLSLSYLQMNLSDMFFWSKVSCCFMLAPRLPTREKRTLLSSLIRTRTRFSFHVLVRSVLFPPR